MTISYEPGQEIQLDLPQSIRKYFAKAKSWRGQKQIREISENVKALEGESEQVEAVLVVLASEIVRTEPPIEISVETLSDAMDYRHIWQAFAALQFNLTDTEKKS